VRAMSGTELSRVRTEFRLRLLEPINKSPLESSRADIVMQSSGFDRNSLARLRRLPGSGQFAVTRSFSFASYGRHSSQ
jgi:hypothetical protein